MFAKDQCTLITQLICKSCKNILAEIFLNENKRNYMACNTHANVPAYTVNLLCAN